MVILKLIEKIPFFWEFTQEEKASLVAQQDTFFANFKKGDYLIREESSESALYILIRGSVNVTKNQLPEVVIATLKPGAVFGEISFLTKQPRTTNVIANEDITVFTISGHKEMRTLDLSLQNKIKDQLINILVKRLDAMNSTLIKLMRS
ncbi:cyclic nucleotide-binding domain-containing protein [Magnetococcales bacterium HHB-1]